MPSDTAPSSARWLWPAALAVVVAMSIALLEIGMAASHWLLPGIFPSRASLERAIDRISKDEFDEYARSVFPPMMWDHLPNSTAEVRSCLGASFTSRYDAAGARTYQGYQADKSTVLLVGDSYTHGDEVADDETIASHLFTKYAIEAANLGVGGYSPLQAVLKVKSRIAHFPHARMVVLGVMHENIRRTVNGYLPALSREAGSVFAARPYASPSSIEIVPSAVYTNLTAFKQHTRTRLTADFWMTPDLSFPYTLSIAQLASSQAFRLTVMSKFNKVLGRQYQSDFANAILRGALFTVVQDFFSWATERNIIPVVIFVPQNMHDLHSGQAWINSFAPRLAYPANIRAAATRGIDWSLYNQKPDGECHPSSYGYAAISSAYASIIRSMEINGRR
jgi:hypothetical protein